jgi:molybdopterin converting factor small subunit
MAVKVLIPTPLRPHAGGQAAAEVHAKTVAEALGLVTSRFSELRKHLFTKEGKLRSFVNIYVNGEDIRYLAQENTPTKDGDTINIIPSIAGGSVTRPRAGNPSVETLQD